MGSEFLRMRAAQYLKRWDKGRVRLGTPDLFTREPTSAPRVVAADVVGQAIIRTGEDFVVQRFGGRFSVMRGLTEVARLSNPPSEILSAAHQSHGMLKGTAQTIHEEAGVVEIAIC